MITTDELRQALDDQERFAPDPDDIRSCLATAPDRPDSRGGGRVHGPLLLAAAVVVVVATTAIVSTTGHTLPAEHRPATVDASASGATTAITIDQKEAEAQARAAASAAESEADRAARAVERCQRLAESVQLDSNHPDPSTIRGLAAACASALGDPQPHSVAWVRTTVRALNLKLHASGYPAAFANDPVIAVQIVGAFTEGGGSGAYLMIFDLTGKQWPSVQGPDNSLDLASLGDVQR